MRLTFLLPVFLCACATVAPDAPPARLHVTSEPAGAMVVATYGQGAIAQCHTPCDVIVPAATQFHLGFQLEGHRLESVTPTRWNTRNRAAPTLSPDTVHATMTPR